MKRDRLDSAFYRLARSMGTPFRFQTIGLENLRDHGPAIFVANHQKSVGPIQAVLSMPVRFYPWVIGEMLDPRRARQYLHDDFVHPTWGLTGFAGWAVSAIVSRIAVALLRELGCISVDRNRGRCVDAFRLSLALLAEGHNLLIFPEDNRQPENPDTVLRPFQCGFIALCYMHERASGKPLPIYPMAVHPGSRTLAVGEAVFFESRDGRRQDIRRICARLEEAVRALYLAQETT